LQLWKKVGGLAKFANQGTESSNHFHGKIVETMGKGALGISKNDHPAVEVCLYLIRNLIYKMPTHQQALMQFMSNWYKTWVNKTNK
jgi:hypothetical protein